MVAVRKKLQVSFIDQESLAEKIKIRKQENPNVKIFYRPRSQIIQPTLTLTKTTTAMMTKTTMMRVKAT